MNNYFDMYSKLNELTEKVTKYCHHYYEKVYSVYIAVGDEKTEQYFVDIEVGGSPTAYHRWRGLHSYDWIIKNFTDERYDCQSFDETCL